MASRYVSEFSREVQAAKKTSIKPDGGVSYESKPPDCTTESAELCSYSTQLGVTITGGSTKTTTATATSVCTTIYGCEVQNSETATKTTTTRACTRALAARDTSLPSHERAVEVDLDVDDAIIYPRDATNVAGIRDALSQAKIDPADNNSPSWLTRAVVSTAETDGFTAFFFIPQVPKCLIDELNARPDVSLPLNIDACWRLASLTIVARYNRWPYAMDYEARILTTIYT